MSKVMPDGSLLHTCDAIDNLLIQPYKGTQLKGDLTGLRRIRIGQYRIIYEIQKKKLVILVVRIGHRKEIYRG